MRHQLLRRMFHAAVDAAQPGPRMQALLPDAPKGRTVVVGAGKASAQMARALEDVWDGPLSVLVVVPHGTADICTRIKLVHAAHPVPDEAGLAATQQLLETVASLSADDLVIALISGGGSSLLSAPAVGLTLADEQAINLALLATGAAISEMNIIRNQFSRIKGGRVSKACVPARVVGFIVSDVPEDDPAVVASGPTIATRRSRDDARRLVALYDIALPEAARQLLDSKDNPAPDSDDTCFARNEVHVVASATASLQAAAVLAKTEGLDAHILSDGIESEASAIGQMHAALAREVATCNRPFARPCVLLSGGETTVTPRGKGKGGRNTEFLLAFAEAVKGCGTITALAADTDGIDGNGTNAGAFCDSGSAGRMRDAGLNPLASARTNDTASAFEAIGDLFTTGPTETNVNDFRAILIQ